MGKKGGSSWLTVVKRAFRSPTKDANPKKSSRRREEAEQDDEEEKKREKRRWLFRKPSNSAPHQNEAKVTAHCAPPPPPPKTPPQLPLDQRHAIAVAAATAAAAEAAAATAHAAVEIIRLNRSSDLTSAVKQNYAAAATLIQTAFRGYLARRALVALKGIVKLQALIRGQNVRKQAKMTLKCMQALLRLQTRMRDHQARLSHDGGGRKSMFAETNNLWDSRYLRDIRERKSLSKDGICIPDEWSECPRTLEELEAALQARKEAAFKQRESSLAYAFSQQQQQQQMWDSDSRYQKEIGDDRTNSWLDKWMATKQWDTCSRGSTDKRDSIKTVEMDMPGKQYSSYHSASANVRKLVHHQSSLHNQKQAAAPHPTAASPRVHRSLNNCPSPSRTRPLQAARPSSPRYLKEEMSYSAVNTPCSSSSLRSMQRLNSSISRYSVSTVYTNMEHQGNNNNNNGNAYSSGSMPNYMAATESAKARVRSQSAPRQRPSTPERDRGGLAAAKKRLSFPVPEPQPNNCFSHNLRSPSFKSVQAGYVGMDLQSNQSCYTDSIAGEISPCSTTDLRKWLRLNETRQIHK